MQTVIASLMVGGASEAQAVRLRLTEDTLYIDRQDTSTHSSTHLPQELHTDSALLAKVSHTLLSS